MEATTFLKLFILESFGESVCFRASERKNASLMVFSAKLSMQEVIWRIRSLDATKSFAQKFTRH